MGVFVMLYHDVIWCAVLKATTHCNIEWQNRNCYGNRELQKGPLIPNICTRIECTPTTNFKIYMFVCVFKRIFLTMLPSWKLLIFPVVEKVLFPRSVWVSRLTLWQKRQLFFPQKKRRSVNTTAMKNSPLIYNWKKNLNFCKSFSSSVRMQPYYISNSSGKKISDTFEKYCNSKFCITNEKKTLLANVLMSYHMSSQIAALIMRKNEHKSRNKMRIFITKKKVAATLFLHDVKTTM